MAIIDFPMSTTVNTPTPKAELAAQAVADNALADFIQETLALTRRLFIQLQRRPSTLVAGIIQPLMWLILFGALFQNAPAGLFEESQNYLQFLGAGVIVFTAFAGGPQCRFAHYVRSRVRLPQSPAGGSPL